MGNTINFGNIMKSNKEYRFRAKRSALTKYLKNYEKQN